MCAISVACVLLYSSEDALSRLELLALKNSKLLLPSSAPPPALAARLLKASLVQPSRDLPTINGRLDCVEELVSDDDLFASIEELVSKFPKVSSVVVVSAR
jgi:DNA mismatch repair protein MSH4